MKINPFCLVDSINFLALKFQNYFDVHESLLYFIELPAIVTEMLMSRLGENSLSTCKRKIFYHIRVSRMRIWEILHNIGLH